MLCFWYVLECSQGTYFDANLTDCVHCPRDSYQNQIGMSHCLQCAKGFTTRNKTGRNSSTDCRRGSSQFTEI